MVDVSQVFNKILGRHEDYRGVAYWEEPERCGWLMKQGSYIFIIIIIIIYVYVHTVVVVRGVSDASH